MTTKAEIIARLKTEYSTLKVGDDEQGYKDLSSVEYDAQIAQWAENEYQATIQQNQIDADKAALLAKLGITADEAKLLLF
jgi:hypothetical protein